MPLAASRGAISYMGGGGAGGAAPAGGWNLTSASYDSKSKSVSAQTVNNTSDVKFSSDGTAMFVLSDNNNSVFQYTLSTAWDVTTATYASKSFSVGTQETGPTGMFFGDSGSKMYIIGYTNDRVYQYTLSTAWDISTASYASKSYLVSTQAVSPQEVFFSSDGTLMFIGNRNSGTAMEVYKYSLSTAWDVSTASYSNQSFSDSTRDLNLRGTFFKSDGTRMYLAGDDNNRIYQYNLSTAWNLTTATYDTFLAIGTQETGPWGMDIKTDGMKLYLVGYGSNTVYQYSLT